jgi:hypothetical protein
MSMKYSRTCLVALLFLCTFTSGSFADMPGKLFKMKTANVGMSKVLFKLDLKTGDLGLTNFWEADPCYDPGARWNMRLIIATVSDVVTPTLFTFGSDWSCKAHPNASFKGTLSSGNCQLRWSLRNDSNFFPQSGKLVVKCLVPLSVATIDSVYIAFATSPDAGYSHDVCFFNATAHPNSPAIVKKDGSDGKSIKMLNAPSDACERP